MSAHWPVGRVLDDRRAAAQMDEAAGGDVYVSYGDVTLGGVGESVVKVRFPVRYMGYPFVSATLDLGDNPIVQRGRYPTCSAVVSGWKLGARATTGERYYEGVTLLVVTSGPADNRPMLRWRAEGLALTGPAGRATKE